jgi:hypothetical protein
MTHTTDTLKALERINDIAKARKLALSKINLIMRGSDSLEHLKASIELALVELDTVERNIVSHAR